MGTDESKRTLHDLLHRQLPSAASAAAAFGKTLGAGAQALAMPSREVQEQVAGAVSSKEPGAAAAPQPALDFSKYKQDGDSSLFWDVETGNGVVAIRHTTTGITLVLSANLPTLACAIVTAGGDEYIFRCPLP